MALKANYDFLFVGKDDNSYLENYSYDLYDKHGEKSGEIFINLEIQNNPANSEEIGEAVFATFQKEFFDRIEEKPYARFEAALKNTNAVLEDFKKQKVSGYIGNLNIVIAAFVGGTLYISQSGDAESYLCRKKYISVITEGLYDENSKDVFSNIANGGIEAGDTVLITSTRLLRYISKTDLGRILAGTDPVEILSELKDTVSTEMLGKMGLTCITFDEETVPESAGEGEEGEKKEEFQNTLIDSLAATQKTISNSRGVSKVKTVFSKIFYKVGGAAKDALSGAVRRSKERRALRGGRSPRDVRASVSGFGAKISDFKKDLFRRGFGSKKVLVSLIAVVVVLVVGIWIVQDSRAKQAQIDQLDNTLIDVQNKIAEAETKGQYDKEAAGQILAKAQEDAMAVLNSGQFRDKASILLKQIEETRDTLDGVKRITAPKLVADLSTKRANVNALGFVSGNGRFFVFEYNALYELVLNQIQAPITLDDKETIIAAASYPDRKSVVFLTKSGKIIEYKDGLISYLNTEEGQFHKGVALRAWTNRLYILDSDGNQIWKYTFQATKNKFGVSAPYAAQGQFTLAKDFAIDSNIWVLNSDGIDKYYGGVKVEFTASKMPFNALTSASKILTSDTMMNIYVLDTKGNRILVFYKDVKTGNIMYQNQYVVEGIGEIRDMYLDQTAKRMRVLTPTSVYEFDL